MLYEYPINCLFLSILAFYYNGFMRIITPGLNEMAKNLDNFVPLLFFIVYDSLNNVNK